MVDGHAATRVAAQPSASRLEQQQQRVAPRRRLVTGDGCLSVLPAPPFSRSVAFSPDSSVERGQPGIFGIQRAFRSSQHAEGVFLLAAQPAVRATLMAAHALH